AYLPRSRKIETIKVHHLGPGRYKVMDKFLLCVRTSVDFGQGPELGIGTEDKVDARAGPLEFTCFTITPFKHVLGVRDRLPLRAHIEQVEEEVVGQRLRSLGEDAMPCLSDVGIQDTQA